MATERSTTMRSNPVRFVDKDGQEVTLTQGLDTLFEDRTAAQTQDIQLEDVVEELRQMRLVLSLMLTELRRATLGLSVLSNEDLTAAYDAATEE